MFSITSKQLKKNQNQSSLQGEAYFLIKVFRFNTLFFPYHYYMYNYFSCNVLMKLSDLALDNIYNNKMKWNYRSVYLVVTSGPDIYQISCFCLFTVFLKRLLVSKIEFSNFPRFLVIFSCSVLCIYKRPSSGRHEKTPLTSDIRTPKF